MDQCKSATYNCFLIQHLKSLCLNHFCILIKANLMTKLRVLNFAKPYVLTTVNGYYYLVVSFNTIIYGAGKHSSEGAV